MTLTPRGYNTACTTWPEGGRAVIVQPNGALFRAGVRLLALCYGITTVNADFAQPLAPKLHPQCVRRRPRRRRRDGGHLMVGVGVILRVRMGVGRLLPGPRFP